MLPTAVGKLDPRNDSPNDANGSGGGGSKAKAGDEMKAIVVLENPPSRLLLVTVNDS